MNISAQQNLKLLWWLRNVAIIGQALAVVVAVRVLQIPIVIEPLWMIIGTLVVVNIYTFWRMRQSRQVVELEFFGQLLIDITALFGLLYFTGGATNPFTSLFILQVIIAAITLTPFYTWIAATVAIGFYTLLMFWNVPVQHFDHNHSGGESFNLHIEGMWISFVLLAIIVAGFLVQMNNIIRRQSALLAEAEKMAAIGTLAASAAHELGTPLATLTVLSEDMSGVFKEQLMRCKQIISRITAAGGVMRAEGGKAVGLQEFLQDIIASWRKDHVDTKLIAEIKGDHLQILGEYNLEQAIRNLLDNAADAAPDEIGMRAVWNALTLTITINDKGAGVAKHIADSVGEFGVTTKEDGLGLGLFLARSVVARLGGSLDLRNENGTVVVMTLPLKRLAI